MKTIYKTTLLNTGQLIACNLGDQSTQFIIIIKSGFAIELWSKEETVNKQFNKQAEAVSVNYLQIPLNIFLEDVLLV